MLQKCKKVKTKIILKCYCDIMIKYQDATEINSTSETNVFQIENIKIAL